MEKTKRMVVSAIIDVGRGEHLGNLLQLLWRFFKVAEIDIPHDPALPLLGI